MLRAEDPWGLGPDDNTEAGMRRVGAVRVLRGAVHGCACEWPTCLKGNHQSSLRAGICPFSLPSALMRFMHCWPLPLQRLLEMMREGGCPRPNEVLSAAKRLFQDGEGRAWVARLQKAAHVRQCRAAQDACCSA